MTQSPALPSIGDVVAPILARVERAQRPLLIASAERLAAERYRSWASASEMAAHAARLRACADREEEIADRVEALFPDPERIQREILAKHPELADVNRSLFAGRPLREQFRIQANGERLGAATWRAFAKQESSSAARDSYLACAELEEASAVVLESLL